MGHQGRRKHFLLPLFSLLHQSKIIRKTAQNRKGNHHETQHKKSSANGHLDDSCRQSSGNQTFFSIPSADIDPYR
jgi:hypothetical protein